MGKTGLMIIDMQNDFCLPGAPFQVASAMTIIPQIKKSLESCRDHKIPVIHVIRYYRSDGSDVEITRYDGFVKAGGVVVRGTKGAEIVKELKPIPGEYLIEKKRYSAFFQSETDNLLKRIGVDQIVVTGLQTPTCIRCTVWDANSLDYEVIVLTDGTGAQTDAIHRANLFDMKNIGIQLMTTDEFVKCLPKVPKANLRQRIQAAIEQKEMTPEPERRI